MNPNRSRKRSRRSEALDLDLNRVRTSIPKTELKRGIEFSVQQSSGGNAEAGKTWMCPVCSISIEQGLAHTVAWDLHRGVETRRHLHNHCWKLFDGQLL
jgi:hypothetical protein